MMEVSFQREERGTYPPQHASKSSADPLQTNTSAAAASPETILQGTFLCSVKAGSDCKFSIYDEANPDETRFRKDGNHREILLELSALLKKAAETNEGGADSAATETPGKVKNALPVGVSYIYTFRNSLDVEFSDMEVTEMGNMCSTLLITTAGDVYGKGRNSLIRYEGKMSPLPMKEGESDFLEEFVKVDVLCGLGIKKICVGSNYGVALTRDNKLYAWGGQRNPPDEAVIMVEEYRAGPCHCGNKSGGRSSLVGGAELMFCVHGKLNYKTYTADCPPPSGVPVKKFIRYDYGPVICPKCSNICTSSQTRYGGFKINYCSACNHIVQNDAQLLMYLRMPFEIDHGIIDVGVSGSRIYTVSENNILKRTNYLTMTDETLETPKGVRITNISCGRGLLAAISDTGELYFNGNLPEEAEATDSGSKSQPLTLQKADVPGQILNVQCSGRTIFCFLADGSKYALYEGKLFKIPDIYVFPAASVEPLLGVYSAMLSTSNAKRNVKDEILTWTSTFDGIHLGDIPTESASTKTKHDPTQSPESPSTKQCATEPSSKPKSKTEASSEGDRTAACLARLENHTLENTVPQDAAYAYVYETYPEENVFGPRTHDRGLSVLVVTGSGEVFGKGGNSLISRYDSPVKIPMKAGGEDILENFEKVDMFRGLAIKKVFVGVGAAFGMALSTEGNLYRWGLFDEVPEEAVVSVEKRGPRPSSSSRKKRSTRGGKEKKKGFGWHEQSTSSDSQLPPRTERFVRYDIAEVRCQCITMATRSSNLYNGYYVNYCPSCKCDIQVDRLLSPFVKVPIQVGRRVADMDGGYLMYCVLYKNNTLEVSTLLDHPAVPKPTTIPVKIPHGVVIESVSCDWLLVADTGSGDLYWCGSVEKPFLFAVVNRLALKLSKVDVPGRVLRYCTAGRSLLCLLADGSFVRIYASMVLPSVSVKPLFDFVFHIRTSFYTEVDGNMEDKISELNRFLVRSRLKSLPPILRKLYGKEAYSDVSLKLADGSFPAHRTILLCKSRYFMKALAHQGPTLELTLHNPRAVKCLLQHLYEVTPDKLNVDDLLDLLEIAVSWDEPTIAYHAVKSLKAEMNVDTIDKMFIRAKSSFLFELIVACDEFFEKKSLLNLFACMFQNGE